MIFHQRTRLAAGSSKSEVAESPVAFVTGSTQNDQGHGFAILFAIAPIPERPEARTQPWWWRIKKGRSDQVESDGLFQGARFLRPRSNMRARFSGEPPSLSELRGFLRATFGAQGSHSEPTSLSTERNMQSPCQNGRSCGMAAISFIADLR